MAAAKDIKFVPDIRLSVRGVDDVVKRFRQKGKQVEKDAAAITRHYGVRLQANVRARARALFNVTDYDKKVRMRVFTGRRGDRLVEVYTDDPQGHRLEFGFVGVDRRGRHVAQEPRPHFRPAAAEIQPSFARAMEKAADK